MSSKYDGAKSDEVKEKLDERWHNTVQTQIACENDFEKKKLSEANTKLLIPSTSLENYKYSVFTQDSNESIVDALMSSAAAPFYFESFLALRLPIS